MWLTVSGAALAAELEVTVRIRTVLENAAGASRAEGQVVLFDAQGLRTSQTSTSAPGTVEVRVPKGRPLKLAAEFPGWWSEPLVLKQPTTEAVLRLVPATVLSGAVRLPAGPAGDADLPTSLELLVEEVPRPERSQGGTVTFARPKRLAGFECPVKSGRFECAVPSGSVNFSLRAKGFITAFFWNQKLPPSAARDLGVLQLVRGASVVGWVASEDGTPAEKIEVALRASSGGMPVDPAKLAMRSPRTRARSDGFFEFAGVAPGGYELVATLSGFEEARHGGITVVKNSETRLREPLVLYRPMPFEVLIAPPSAPDGSPWQVSLVRGQGGGDDHREAKGPADASGHFAAKGLIPGVYRLELRDGLENLAHAEELTVVPRAQPLWVTLDVIEIHGTLSVGRKPVENRDFSLIGSAGSIIRLRSKDEGRYADT